MTIQKMQFGEWLPDRPDLDNPGLTEAQNVLFSGGAYLPYSALSVSGTQVAGTPLAAFRGTNGNNSVLYVASTDGNHNYLYAAPGTSFGLVNQITMLPTGLMAGASFAQYGTNVFFADGVNAVRFNALNVSYGFPSIGRTQFGTPPFGTSVGVIGQFLLIANDVLNGNPTVIQWSSINAPFSWPTPNSPEAVATQAGLQVLDYDLGAIQGIAQGDQWGLVLSYNGIERVTYVGGDVVFQFDNIYRGPSAVSPQCWVKAAGMVYSCAGDGFLMTDGVSVRRIGDTKVDRWFLANWDGGAVHAGFDPARKLIYWSFTVMGSGNAHDAWIAYNYAEDRWTHGTDGIACYVRGEEVLEWQPGYGMQGISSAAHPSGGGFGGTLTATPGSGLIRTAEIELNPGGRAIVRGFKPQIFGTPGAAVTARIGSRARSGDAITYTPALALNGVTNFANTLVDANYHRVEVSVQGAFTQALGGELDAIPSGDF